jgi:hypothetical protein
MGNSEHSPESVPAKKETARHKGTRKVVFFLNRDNKTAIELFVSGVSAWIAEPLHKLGRLDG